MSLYGTHRLDIEKVHHNARTIALIDICTVQVPVVGRETPSIIAYMFDTLEVLLYIITEAMIKTSLIKHR